MSCGKSYNGFLCKTYSFRDYDRVAKDSFMGCTSFSVPELMTSCPPSGWFQLLTSTDGRILNLPCLTIVVAASDTTESLHQLWRRSLPDIVFEMMSKDECHCQEAMFEFIHTERAFYNDVQLVLHAYSRESFGDLITDDQYQLFFGPLQEIHDVTLPFLIQLDNVINTDTGVVSPIAETIHLHLPIMEPSFASFCESNRDITRSIQLLRARSPAFAAVLTEGQRRCNHMDLHSFRLKPLQRVTKYLYISNAGSLCLPLLIQKNPVQHRICVLFFSKEFVRPVVISHKIPAAAG